MKALIASMTALGLIAAPAVAQTTNTPASTKTTTSTSTSVKTTSSKGRHAMTKHHTTHKTAKCSCPSTHAKAHHHTTVHKTTVEKKSS